ncbi:MAG: uroporphyrinogen decarboxylase family protein [Candidatus Hydrothermarchaeaceae archaeon]
MSDSLIVDAIRGKDVERVPVAPMITVGHASKIYGIKPLEYILDSKKYAEAQIHCKRFYGYDWVWSHQPFQGVSKKERENVVVKEDHAILKLDLGTELKVAPGAPPQVFKTAISSKEDLGGLKIPDPNTSDRMAPLRNMLKEEDFVCGTIRCPFTLASSYIYDLEPFLMDLRLDEKFVFELLDFSLEYCVEYVRAQIEEGAGAMYMIDSSASSSVISPDAYRKFALPYQKALAKEIKDVPTILHVCGDIIYILDDIMSTGVDCLSIDEQMDIVDVHKRIPVLGNVAPGLLVRGTPEEVRKVCDRIVELKERVVLSSGCVIPPTAKVENVKEMVRASHMSG